MKWLKQVFARNRRYNDLSVSIREHIEERAEELIEQGMPQKEAEQQARREFGNVALIEQRSREAWQWARLERLLADLKLALRRLRRSPGFAATVLLTLAIGIGANTAVFSVVNSVILKPLPYPDSGRLAALWLDAPGGGLANFSDGLELSPSMYFTFREHNKTFQSLGVWVPSLANVTGVAVPEEVKTAMVSDGVLETLGVPPAVGRWFNEADQDPHGAKTVMLSYGYWQRRFGGDRGVIGRSIQVDSVTREIVGVMPRGFKMVDFDFDLMEPVAFDRGHLKLAPFGYRGIGRLKPGVTLEEADADIARLIPVWMDSWSNGPKTDGHYYRIWRIAPHFRTLKQQVIGNMGGVLWIVMATVGLVMLIACMNVANLLLVRAESRQMELSIRAALGAGRGRIARELLVESVMLGLMGGALAVGVAYAGLRLLVAMGPAELPRLSEISLDGRALVFTLGLSVLSGLVFGSIPAVKYAWARNSLAMGGTSRTASAGRRRQGSRNVLVVGQVAMALVLLVSALLMIRSFAALRDVDPGFADAAHVQTMRIWIPDLLIEDPVMVTRVQNEIADKIAAIPGVTGVGFAGSVPMDGVDPNWDMIIVEGKNYAGGMPPMRLYNYVAPGFFRAMGTRFVAGRDYTWADIYGMRPRLIVSENFARDTWGSAQAAIGKRLRQFENQPWREVIGVVENVHVHGADEAAPAIIYWPAMLPDPYSRTPAIQAPRAVAFAIHSDRAGQANFIDQVKQAVWQVNGNLPMAQVETMGQIYGRSMARTSFTLTMLAIAGAMALLLGVIGIYGVISYAVSQRTREIGIRLALGAKKSGLQWLFVRSALGLTGVGVGIGLCAAAALMQLMRSLLFGVSPVDPLTYIAVPLALGACAVVASYLPARRAASVDPVEALRAE
jgi:putative ABC transport system permease protein